MDSNMPISQVERTFSPFSKLLTLARLSHQVKWTWGNDLRVKDYPTIKLLRSTGELGVVEEICKWYGSHQTLEGRVSSLKGEWSFTALLPYTQVLCVEITQICHSLGNTWS
jgi:hypothetical protein